MTFYGKPARVVKVTRRADVTQIYAYAMATPLGEVRTLKIWHALRCWHRAVHRSVSTQALAEHCGSVLRFLEKRVSGGRPRAVGRSLLAARLRMAGMTGEGGEDAILASALNYHFQSAAAGPEGWHVAHVDTNVRRRSKVGEGASLRHARFRQEARSERLPAWRSRLLSHRCFRFAKLLLKRPRSGGGAPGAEASSSLSKQRRRDVARTAEEYEAGSQDQVVWRRADAGLQSIPVHLRGRSQPTSSAG